MSGGRPLRGLAEDEARGEGRGASVERVDRVERGEVGIREPDAADVGDDGDPLARGPHGGEGLVEGLEHVRVPAARAVGGRRAVSR